MIGWENDRGAYFINKLQDEVDAVKETADDAEENIGKMSDLTTTAKTTLVGAINEVDSNADSANTAIGTLASLETTAKTDLVSAINEVSGIANGVNAKVVEFESFGGGKQATISNSGSTHVIMLVIGISTESTLKCAFAALLSGSAVASKIMDLATAGSNTTVSASGKTITIQNKTSSSTMHLKGIIFNNPSSVSYSVDTIPTT